MTPDGKTLNLEVLILVAFILAPLGPNCQGSDRGHERVRVALVEPRLGQEHGLVVPRARNQQVFRQLLHGNDRVIGDFHAGDPESTSSSAYNAPRRGRKGDWTKRLRRGMGGASWVGCADWEEA